MGVYLVSNTARYFTYIVSDHLSRWLAEKVSLRIFKMKKQAQRCYYGNASKALSPSNCLCRAVHQDLGFLRLWFCKDRPREAGALDGSHHTTMKGICVPSFPLYRCGPFMSAFDKKVWKAPKPTKLWYCGFTTSLPEFRAVLFCFIIASFVFASVFTIKVTLLILWI